ncbi:hypothetical protein ADUPG1_006096, partial [Aduncisulcus paluster]
MPKPSQMTLSSLVAPKFPTLGRKRPKTSGTATESTNPTPVVDSPYANDQVAPMRRALLGLGGAYQKGSSKAKSPPTSSSGASTRHREVRPATSGTSPSKPLIKSESQEPKKAEDQHLSGWDGVSEEELSVLMPRSTDKKASTKEGEKAKKDDRTKTKKPGKPKKTDKQPSKGGKRVRVKKKPKETPEKKKEKVIKKHKESIHVDEGENDPLEVSKRKEEAQKQREKEEKKKQKAKEEEEQLKIAEKKRKD